MFLPTPLRAIGRVGMLLILLCTHAMLPQVQPNGFVAMPDTAPAHMAEFLATKAPPGRVFNDYEYSAGLEWFLHGRRELYIDLINAYPSDIADVYKAMLTSEPKWLQFLEKNQIKVVALRPMSKDSGSDALAGLYQWLNASPDWKTAYNGKDGRVWVRSTP